MLNNVNLFGSNVVFLTEKMIEISVFLHPAVHETSIVNLFL